MKRLKYMLIATIFMFIGINGVSAKEVEKTCLYQAVGAVNPYMGAEGQIATDGDNEVTVYIYDNGSASAKITVAKGMKKNQTVKVANWNNVKDSYNGSCFGYILVEYDWGNTVYVSNSKTELNNIASSNNWELGKKAFIISSNEREASSEEKNTALEYVKNATTQLQNLNLKVDSCRDGNNLTPCNQLYSDVNNMLGVFKSTISNYVTSNILELDDIKDLENLIDDVTIDLGNFNTEIKEEQKKIDISDQSGSNPGESIVVDPNYKYGCEIFGDTMVELIHKVYGYFKWIIPVLIVVLSMLDFVKVVGTGKDDDFKKAQNNLIKRIILGVVFFLVPTIISLIISFSGITEQFTNGDSIMEAVTCILK